MKAVPEARPSGSQVHLLSDLSDGRWHCALVAGTAWFTAKMPPRYSVLTLWQCVQAGWVEPGFPGDDWVRITAAGQQALRGVMN